MKKGTTRRATKLKEITLAILAWKSPQTLKNTLESYKKHGLLKMVHPVI